jgi:hypothetical protein
VIAKVIGDNRCMAALCITEELSSADLGARIWSSAWPTAAMLELTHNKSEKYRKINIPTLKTSFD